MLSGASPTSPLQARGGVQRAALVTRYQVVCAVTSCPSSQGLVRAGICVTFSGESGLSPRPCCGAGGCPPGGPLSCLRLLLLQKPWVTASQQRGAGLSGELLSQEMPQQPWKLRPREDPGADSGDPWTHRERQRPTLVVSPARHGSRDGEEKFRKPCVPKPQNPSLPPNLPFFLENL